jgi:hypothetical protein
MSDGHGTMSTVWASSRSQPIPVHSLLDTTYESYDAMAGCILWLPKKDEIDEHLLVGVRMDDGCFNHPVVVLSADPVERKATILIVSILIQTVQMFLDCI